MEERSGDWNAEGLPDGIEGQRNGAGLSLPELGNDNLGLTFVLLDVALPLGKPGLEIAGILPALCAGLAVCK